MEIGIIVCGLNGSGKSTLGKALSEKLGFRFIDNENLYFPGCRGEQQAELATSPKTDPNYIYASPRSRNEVEILLMDEVRTYKNFVFAAVKGDYGKEILPLYNYAVLIDVPKEIRMQRVRNRAFQQFGDRMLKGGDLYEQEEAFFNFVNARPEHYVEEWVQTLNCPIIRVDGTGPIKENLTFIMEQIQH